MEDSSQASSKKPEPNKGASSFGSGSFVPPPEDPRDQSSLGELEKRLYKTDQNTSFEPYRSKLSRAPLNRPHIPFSPQEAQRMIEKKALEREPFLSPFLSKILLAAFVLFLLVTLVFGYVYFGGGSLGGGVQAVSVTVSGPVSAAGGSPVSFELVFQNNGGDLAESDAVITFPPGTRSALDPNKELPRLIEDIGPLKKGERSSKIIRAIFFGQENTEKEISVEYSFRAAGTNATYQRTKTYAFKLTGSPITLGATLPDSLVSGREVSFDIKLVSNANAPLGDVLLVASYPPGFSFIKSTPAPALSTNIWSVGDMAPGQSRVVHVEGVLEGEDADTKLFRFEAGTAKSESLSIAAPYGTLVEEVALERPPLSASVFVNGSSSEKPSIEDASEARVLVTLANNTTDPLENVRLLVRFAGELVDRSEVAASKGFYRSTDSTILWDKSTFPALAELSPGEAVDLDFLIGTQSANRSGTLVVNPKIVLDIDARADRTVAGTGEVEVVSKLSRTVHISTLASFGTRSLYSTGPFKNTGPYPPKAEKETTYTITWTLANTANALSRAVAQGKLPTYVTWMGATAPQSEDLKWNEESRTVIWNAGDVAARTGYAGAPRSVSFQVRFTPSLGQVGTVPVLVDSLSFGAVDSFTNARIEGIKSALTTELITDPIFTGEGRVAK